MSHVTYAEEIHALETILARVRQEKAALEREARYHQQELDTLLGKLRAYEQSYKNLSADCDALARERDALAAHVEAAVGVIGNIDAGMDERKQWIRDKPATSPACLEAELAEEAKKHFLYGYGFCRANGFLYDDALQRAADEYVRQVCRQAEGGNDAE